MLRKRDNMGPDLEELGIRGIGNGVSRRRGVGVVYLFGLWKEVQRWDLEDWLRGSRNEVAWLMGRCSTNVWRWSPHFMGREDVVVLSCLCLGNGNAQGVGGEVGYRVFCIEVCHCLSVYIRLGVLLRSLVADGLWGWSGWDVGSLDSYTVRGKRHWWAGLIRLDVEGFGCWLGLDVGKAGGVR